MLNNSAFSTRILHVPLIDIAKLPSATFMQGRLSTLQKVCSEWTVDSTERVITWINASRLAIRELKDRPNSVSHTQSYVPHYGVENYTSRTLEEASLLSCFDTETAWDAVRHQTLDALIMDIGTLAGQPRGFRHNSIGTKVDHKGESIEYPSWFNIERQLVGLTNWLRSNAEHREACAVTAMNVIFNVHPFNDKNGLCGRIIFNLLCSRPGQHIPVLPLHELSVASQGKFLLSLRLAQYFGDWSPLLDTINRCAQFTQKVISPLDR